MARARTEKKGNIALELITASVIAVLISLILILLCALIIKWLNLSDGWLMPVNQVIKAVSMFTGALLGFRDKRRGWAKGLALGVIYIILAFLIFSLIFTAHRVLRAFPASRTERLR